jgi:DNA-binding response OmpR family regulator
MAKILVIDDDPEMRSALEQTLKLAGHDVMLAEDGEQGLKVLRDQPANLVITDIFMPNKEGFETINTLRKDFPNVPIIAISGRPELGNVLAIARRLGSVRTLAKPFQSPELLAAVEEALQTKPGAPGK